MSRVSALTMAKIRFITHLYTKKRLFPSQGLTTIQPVSQLEPWHNFDSSLSSTTQGQLHFLNLSDCSHISLPATIAWVPSLQPLFLALLKQSLAGSKEKCSIAQLAKKTFNVYRCNSIVVGVR